MWLLQMFSFDIKPKQSYSLTKYEGEIKMKVDTSKCVGCGACMAVCPAKAIDYKDGKAFIDTTKCVGCQTCVSVCPMQAITIED